MTQTSLSEEAIFLAALDKPTHQERAAYVEEACAGNDALRKRIHELLASHDASRGPLDEPPVALGATSDALAERPGTQIGPYKLIEQIGEGGMGTVWMAQQSEPVKRQVAVKLIKAGMDSRQVIARFEAERQALALMDHTNIARVLDAGTTLAGRPYFVMDLVRGVPVTRYCDEHHLTPRQRLELFIPVCQAIQHAHQKGIIHRDLKPNNVLVALYDGKPVPKVIDFGVAKATGQSLTDKTLVTGFGNIVGTLEYMSPEQAEINQLDIDTRSDIYSLGVLLYELLTGSTPFSRKALEKAGMLEMLRVIREEEPSKPSTKLSTAEGLPTLAANRGTEPAKLTRLVRGELDWIVMKSLEKDRSRRYETANGLALDVQRYLDDEPVQACPPSTAYRFRKFVRRNRGTLTAASMVAVAVLIAMSGIGWAVRDRSAREADLVRQRTERQVKLAAQIESIFFDVARLEKGQKWPEALAAVRRAEAAVAGGDADAASTARVNQRLRNIELIDRLEQIRMQRATTIGGEFDDAGVVRQYSRAFHDYGVDIEGVPIGVSIDRLKAYESLVVPLAAAMDDWAHAQSVVSKEDAARWKRLVAIARGIDPDPMRDRLRSYWGQTLSATERDALLQLAVSMDIRVQHPATIIYLSRSLTKNNLPDPALKLLRDARRIYPGDFWLNFELGVTLGDRKDWDGAIRFYTAAAAIRPNSAAALRNLGFCLRQQQPEQLDEAIDCFLRAIELDPGSARGYRELGFGLLLQGKLDEAVAAYRRAIELDPQNWYGQAGLGIVIWQLANHADPMRKDCKRAIKLSQEFVEAVPQSGGSWQFLGWVQYRAGNWQASLEALEKSCKLQEGGVGDCGQWIVMSLAHAKLADQASLPQEEREHHRAQARRWYAETDKQLAGWGTARPTDGVPQAIWDFRTEAWALIGAKERGNTELLPPPGALLESARTFAEKRQWKNAAIVLNEAVEQPRSAEAFLCFSSALVRLLAGDEEGYVRLAEKMSAFHPQPWERGDVLRTCTIHPRGSNDPVELVRLSRADYDEVKNNWTAHNLGLAHYRAGNFEEALRRMEEAWQISQWHLFLPTLAMVHHQLGHADEARQWLASAETVFADVTANDGERIKTLQDDPYWQDWAYFEVMLQEAKGLIDKDE